MIYRIFITTLSLMLFSCSAKVTDVDSVNLKIPDDLIINSIDRDFITWWTYFNENIILSDNFIGLDTSMIEISKELFLTKLVTGSYIPIKLSSNDSLTYLKLHALSEGVDNTIISTISDKSTSVLGQFRMEGEEFPEFDFLTLDSIRYNNINTKGKFIVVKCWFLACGACIKEIPDLNRMVHQYRNRTDLEFVSLAYDSPELLNKFLEKKEFNYSVVSVDRVFMENELNVYNYPTHIILDKLGRIRKVVNNFHELELALKKLI